MSRTAWIIVIGLALVGGAIALYFLTRGSASSESLPESGGGGGGEGGRVAGTVAGIGQGLTSIATSIAGAAEGEGDE